MEEEMLLKPPPHTESISVSGPQGSRRYAVASDGLIHNVAESDLVQLLAAGCESATPPPPKPEAPPKVRLRGRPHGLYAPAPENPRVRYQADAEGYFDAAPEHLKALLRAGCVRA
jgi:hypothetical protein